MDPTLHSADPANPWVTLAINTIGRVAFYEGRYAEAQTLHEEALARYRQLGDVWEIAHSLANLADVSQLEGRHAEARDHHKDDPTGIESLKKVIGRQSLEDFEKDWQKWVLTLRFG